MDIIEKIILIVLPVLVTALLYSIITRKLQEREQFVNSKNLAALHLKDVFAPAIAKFPLLSDANAIKQMLREELIPQSVAIERFRSFVPPGKKEAYQEAWEKYHQSHKRDGVSSVYFLDYAIGDEKERFRLFNERIHNILQFTE